MRHTRNNPGAVRRYRKSRWCNSRIDRIPMCRNDGKCIRSFRTGHHVKDLVAKRHAQAGQLPDGVRGDN